MTLRLAHRGDWRVAPENSLAAMAAALRIPACDGLEFDVRGSRDGVPVLLHDASLERVQGLAAAVDSLTAAELAGHGVASLEEVLTSIVPASGAGGRDEAAFLDVELKGDPMPAVIGVLEAARGRSLDRAVVSSFEARTLRWVHEQRSAWPLWLNATAGDRSTIDLAKAIGCSGVAVEFHSIDAETMAGARDAGLTVAAWTVRARADYDRLVELGVSAVCAEDAALDGEG